MDEIYISFYLRCSRIHVFVDSLRTIGSPRRICFMIAEDGKSLLIAPYKKRDLKSHRVPDDAYIGYGMEICSMKLCRLIASLHKWDTNNSYRVPGRKHINENVIIYDLTRAVVINRTNSSTCPIKAL